MGIVDETAEWRSHNADEMNRVGAAMSAHLSEKGNTCVITDTGGASAKKMAAAQRMLNADALTDALIMEHMRDLSRLCHDLDLPECGPAKERAVALLAAVRKKATSALRASRPMALAAWALYEACGAMGSPRSLGQLCGAAGVSKKEANQAKNLIRRHLTECEHEAALQRRAPKLTGTALWMSRVGPYVQDLHGCWVRGPRGRNIAAQRLEKVLAPYAERLERSGVVEGRNPDTISAALVVLGCHILGFGQVTPKEVRRARTPRSLSKNQRWTALPRHLLPACLRLKTHTHTRNRNLFPCPSAPAPLSPPSSSRPLSPQGLSYQARCLTDTHSGR